MYTRGRFDEEFYMYSDRHLRDAESLRRFDIARKGKPGTAASLLIRIRITIAAYLIRASGRLQPTLPSRPLAG